MAYKKADLVQETSSSTGSTTMVLAGATSNKRRRFRDAMSNGDTCTVLIEHATAAEAQICDATYASDVLTIGTVLWSTTGSAINFSAGVKTITDVAAASRMVMMDPNGDAAVTRDLAVGQDVYSRNVTATYGQFVSAVEARDVGKGRVALHVGAGSQTGYLATYKADGTRVGYIGWAQDGLEHEVLPGGRHNIKVEGYGQITSVNGYGLGILMDPLPTTSPLQVVGDATLHGSGRSVMFNAYYASGWKYAANGYPFVIRDDANGYVHFYGGALNSSGAGASLSPQGIVSLNLLSPCLFPFTDNSVPLGAALNRWSVVYAGTGSINTSGRDAKLEIVEASAAEREWARLIRERGPRRYKLKDAVDAKGDAARWHFGYVVEDILADAETAGIVDPWRYAFLCRDRKIVREAYTETEMREKRRTGTVEETAIEIRDGMPVLVRKSVEREERVGAMVAVKDEQGNPVVRDVRDQDGNVTGTTPVLHFVPEMEEVEVERFRDVETDEWQYGLRYSELEAFLACVTGE